MDTSAIDFRQEEEEIYERPFSRQEFDLYCDWQLVSVSHKQLIQNAWQSLVCGVDIIIEVKC